MATAIRTDATGRPAHVKSKHGMNVSSWFKHTGDEESIKHSVMNIATTLEKHLQASEKAIKQAEKYVVDENPELRDLVTACADKVAASNDIQRYYDQTFQRMGTTMELCIKEKQTLHDLGKDLDKLRKHMGKLAKKQQEKTGTDSGTSKAMAEDVDKAEETHQEILRVYIHLHTRLRRALFNLSVAKMEAYRKLAAVELQFVEHLRRFKTPVTLHDDGLVEFKDFKSELPASSDFAGWFDGSWSPPSWIGDTVVASIEDLEVDGLSSPGSSPGGSPAPIYPGNEQPGLEKGLYPGKAAGRSMVKGRLGDDPAEHPHRPRKDGLMQEQEDRHTDGNDSTKNVAAENDSNTGVLGGFFQS